MANVTVWTSRTRKRTAPRNAFDINPSSPFARGLLYASWMPRLVDLVSGDPMLVSSSFTGSKYVDRMFPSFQLPAIAGNSSYWLAAYNLGVRLAWQIPSTSVTAMLPARFNTLGTAVDLGWYAAYSGSATYSGVGFRKQASDTLDVLIGTGSGGGSGSRRQRFSSSAVVANRDYILATSYTNAGYPDIYIDGKLDNGSTSGTGASMGFTGSASGFCGVHSAGGVLYDGLYGGLFVWQGHKSAEWHAALSRHPFDFVKGSARTYFLPGPNSGLTGPNSPAIWTSKTRNSKPTEVVDINRDNPITRGMYFLFTPLNIGNVHFNYRAEDAYSVGVNVGLMHDPSVGRVWRTSPSSSSDETALIQEATGIDFTQPMPADTGEHTLAMLARPGVSGGIARMSVAVKNATNRYMFLQVDETSITGQTRNNANSVDSLNWSRSTWAENTAVSQWRSACYIHGNDTAAAQKRLIVDGQKRATGSATCDCNNISYVTGNTRHCVGGLGDSSPGINASDYSWGAFWTRELSDVEAMILTHPDNWFDLLHPKPKRTLWIPSGKSASPVVTWRG